MMESSAENIIRQAGEALGLKCGAVVTADYQRRVAQAVDDLVRRVDAVRAEVDALKARMGVA